MELVTPSRCSLCTCSMATLAAIICRVSASSSSPAKRSLQPRRHGGAAARGEALQLRETRDRQDARHDRRLDAGRRGQVAKAQEHVHVEEELRDRARCAGVQLALQIVEIEQRRAAPPDAPPGKPRPRYRNPRRASGRPPGRPHRHSRPGAAGTRRCRAPGRRAAQRDGARPCPSMRGRCRRFPRGARRCRSDAARRSVRFPARYGRPPRACVRGSSRRRRRSPRRNAARGPPAARSMPTAVLPSARRAAERTRTRRRPPALMRPPSLRQAASQRPAASAGACPEYGAASPVAAAHVRHQAMICCCRSSRPGLAGLPEQQQPATRPQDAARFANRRDRLLGIAQYVVEHDRVEFAIRERQVIHIALAQAAIFDAGQQQLGACQLAGISIDIDADRTLRPRAEQFENAALATADIEQVTERCRDRELDQRMVQPAQVVIVLLGRRDALRSAQLRTAFRSRVQTPARRRATRRTAAGARLACSRCSDTR